MKSKLKIILGTIVGILIGTSVTVYAYNYQAKDIIFTPTDKSWEVDNVEEALDEIYKKSKYEEYTGSITIKPSDLKQTLSTKDRFLKDNIVIESIPNDYKKLSTQTTATSSHILSGKTAYDNNGNLITGNVLVDNCVTGSFKCTSCTTSSGQDIGLTFEPSSFVLYVSDLSLMLVYDDSTQKWGYATTNSVINLDDNFENYFVKNNNLILRNWATSYNNKTFIYSACK